MIQWFFMVDGKIVEHPSDYTIRFVDQPNGMPIPVLYLNGKRVTLPWKIVLQHEAAADSKGCSA